MIDGQDNPILPLNEALGRARGLGQTLVEVSEKADPPVVKVVDFKKFLYEQKRKKQPGKTKKSVLKELRFSPNIGENDLNLRIHRAREFLKASHQVKIVVAFRGREITHLNIGAEKLKTVLTALEKDGKPEGEFKKLGKFLSVILVPR